jgi:trimethylamine--corrinoid protein Co-methyltransferase
LTAIAAQSTAFIPSDVPDKISDSYRLFLSLLYCSKPVVTGVFRIESFELMKDFLIAIRGSEKDLKIMPLTIFSCCPTSPLKWSNVTSQNLIDCAKLSIPVEIIAMPLAGFIAPVSLMGTLIQHTAETLSGIVLSQLINPGTPILYGGSPAIFDVRYQTTPMGAMETMMIDCAYNEIGKSFKIPTQAYISLSDSKLLDAQAGLETGMGAVLSTLAGINNISGPGMMDFENCFSLEKLVVDNEICAMTQRMISGIANIEQESILPLMDELLLEGNLLATEHTMTYLRSEHKYPGKIIERSNHSHWVGEGEQTINQRAEAQVKNLIDSYDKSNLSKEIQKELIKLMQAEAKLYGMEKLPDFQI